MLFYLCGWSYRSIVYGRRKLPLTLPICLPVLMLDVIRRCSRSLFPNRTEAHL